MSLKEKVFLIQSDVSKMIKDGTNSHHRHKYSTLESTLDALNDKLKEHQVVVVQKPSLHEGVWVLMTEITHGKESEDFPTPLLGIEGAKNPMQALGSALTYARRYALWGYFKLAPTDDDGELLKQSSTAQTRKEPFKPDKIVEAYEKLGVSKKDLESRYEKSLDKLESKEKLELKDIYKQLRDGSASKNDYFGGVA